MARAEQEARLRLTAQDETARAFQAVQRNLRETARQNEAGARGMRDMFRGAEGAVDEFSRTLTRSLSAAAVVEFSRRSFEAFSDYQRSLTRIQVATGVSREQMRAMGEDMQKLAVQFGRPVEDIVAGFDRMQKESTLSAADIAKIFPQIVEGANAAQVTTSQMSTAVAALMRGFHLPVSETQKIIDDLVGSGKGELDEIVQAIPRLSTVMGSLGAQGEEGVRRLVSYLAVLGDALGGTEAAEQSLIRLIMGQSPYMVAALR
jgi:hypothetical protein